ncbi:MAG: tetratricopeptide repeat protein [Nitrospiria bacterium]
MRHTDLFFQPFHRTVIFFRCILACLLLGGIQACAHAPRIVILKDSLSSGEHLQLGLSYEAQDKWDLALDEYRSALKSGGEPSLIEGYIGNIHVAREELSLAKAAYRRALRVNPDHAAVLNNLAGLYLIENKNLKEAERLVRRAIAIDPTRRVYYLDTLGSIYEARNEYDIALILYQEAEGLIPEDSPIKHRLNEHKTRARILMLMEDADSTN